MRGLALPLFALALGCAPTKLTEEQYYGGALPEDGAPADGSDGSDAVDATDGDDVPDITESPDVPDAAPSPDAGPGDDAEDAATPTDTVPPEDTGPLDDAESTDVVDDAESNDIADGADAEAPLDAGDTTDTDDAGPCFVDCAGKQCGDNGCGGSCGGCAPGFACNKAQFCVPECLPQCFKKQCGPDQCGDSCGTCPGDFECGADGKCYDPVCTPACDGRVCGDDGCEGSCGTCSPGDLCQDGQCVAGPCSGVPFDTGKCQDDKALQCLGGTQLVVKDCPSQSKACGWNPVAVAYDCIEQGQCFPQCTAQECGDDGCGGLCGVCPPNWPCANGTCIATEGGGCGYYNVVGTCAQDILWWCEGGVLRKRDCASEGKACGFNSDLLLNQCL